MRDAMRGMSLGKQNSLGSVNLLGNIAGLFGGAFANGGMPPMGKISLVGERGPELFVPRMPGTIIPNGGWDGGAAGGDGLCRGQRGFQCADGSARLCRRRADRAGGNRRRREHGARTAGEAPAAVAGVVIRD